MTFNYIWWHNSISLYYLEIGRLATWRFAQLSHVEFEKIHRRSAPKYENEYDVHPREGMFWRTEARSRRSGDWQIGNLEIGTLSHMEIEKIERQSAPKHENEYDVHRRECMFWRAEAASRRSGDWQIGSLEIGRIVLGWKIKQFHEHKQDKETFSWTVSQSSGNT